MSLPSPPLTAGSEENLLPECSQGKKSWQPQGHAPLGVQVGCGILVK
jgi:hypothetical protein